MHELVEEWVSYFDGTLKKGKRFDAWEHFSSIFTLPLSEEEIRRIFQFFPKKDELTERLKFVYAAAGPERGIYVGPGSRGSKEDCLDIAKAHFSELSIILNGWDNERIGKFFQTAPIRFADRQAVQSIRDNFGFDADVRNAVKDTIGYAVPKDIDGVDDKIFVLCEAFYTVTTNFDVEHFLEGPLLNIKYKGEAGARLWAMGGNYAITPDEVLVCNELADV